MVAVNLHLQLHSKKPKLIIRELGPRDKGHFGSAQGPFLSSLSRAEIF